MWKWWYLEVMHLDVFKVNDFWLESLLSTLLGKLLS